MDTLPKEVKEYIESLCPEDIGKQSFGNLLLQYEGFTFECWDDAYSKGKNDEDMEKELLGEWKGNGKLLKFDWHDCSFEEDEQNVFWALYEVLDK